MLACVDVFSAKYIVSYVIERERVVKYSKLNKNGVFANERGRALTKRAEYFLTFSRYSSSLKELLVYTHTHVYTHIRTHIYTRT